MAKTRSQIKEMVELHTGRTDKDTLMNRLCDNALKLAVMRHGFQDARELSSDLPITASQTSISIASLTGLIDIVTARVVDVSGTRNAKLTMKDKQWFDQKFPEPPDEFQSWPQYGLRWGTNVIFNCPVDSGIALRLRYTFVPSFTDDSTECPIEVADIFVEHYVTAFVFGSLQETEAFAHWRAVAVGPAYERGIIGGSLKDAIDADSRNTADELVMNRGNMDIVSPAGLSILDLREGSENYGNLASWF